MSNTPEILHSVLRQYRHNNGDGFVFGFDFAGTVQVVTALQGEIERLKQQEITTNIDDFKEAVKAELIAEGYTPPNKTNPAEWQPKDGELVLCNNVPRHYDSYMGADTIRPHPTHLCWETGALPEKGLILVQWKGTRSDGGPIIGLWPAKDIHKESCDVKRWARLPLEES